MIRLTLALLVLGLIGPLFAKAPKLPNIIVIMADDLGPGDIGTMHRKRTGKAPVVDTLNMDQLLSDGMRFDLAHAPNSLCAPTRFSMLTGNYSWRNYQPFGVWQVFHDPGIEPNFTTSARIAKEAGYATAFFGKWGLGGNLKTAGGDKVAWDTRERADYERIYKAANYFGFDHAIELPSGIQGTPLAWYRNGVWERLAEDSVLRDILPKQSGYANSRKQRGDIFKGDSAWDPTIAGPRLVEEAVRFIEDHRKKQGDQPFFIYFCSQAVHIPHTPPQMYAGVKVAGKTPGVHADMILEFDLQVGQIVKTLKKQGIYENTLLIVTSDNGGLKPDPAAAKMGHDSSNGLRGFKSSIYDGGSRVPFIAVWPDVIQPGSICKHPVVAHDIVATIASIGGIRTRPGQVLDSLDLLPLFRGDPASDRVLHYQSINGPTYGIRSGQWKLVLKAPSQDELEPLKPIGLYNLVKNPNEAPEENLVNSLKHKGLVADLLTLYRNSRTSGQPTVFRMPPS